MLLEEDMKWGQVPDLREDTTLPSTADEWRALMVATIKERGEDYIYEAKVYGDCLYLAHDGETGEITGGACLIGCMLLKAGVDPEKLSEVEGLTARTALMMGARNTIDTYILDALHGAQRVQDDGQPWGEALRRFDAVIDAAPARDEVPSLV